MPARTPAPHETLRLFIALWPDAATRAWLDARDAAISWPRGAAREPEARRHLTLHFLGAVARAQVAELMPALQQPFDAFELELDRVVAWPRGLVVAEPAHVPAALNALHAALGAALQRAGQRVETRAFRPHVTMARRAAGALWPTAATAQRWQVSAFALVASAGGVYRNLALYPGGVFSGSSADPAPATARSPPARRPTPG